MVFSQDDIKDIPNERRHSLVCKQSGGLLFPKATGVQPMIFIRAEFVDTDDNRTGEDHFIMIDLRDAIILKRSIERTLAEVEKKDPNVIYQERTN